MNAFYNTCFADPWILVAQKLNEQHNIKPVYWIGYEDDNSEISVQQVFPGVVYHKYFDAWKGIFSDKINNIWHRYEIDIDFLRDFSSYELQAIKMMDRMDADQHSFSFMERQRHFRNLVKNFSACIDMYNIDLVVSAIVPHRVYDYVLYLICQYKKIPFLTFKNTAFSGRIIPARNVFSVSCKINEDYELIKKQNLDIQEITDKIESDIIDRYNKVLTDYSVAIPDYMKQHVIKDRQQSNILGNAITFYNKVINNKDKYFGKNGYFHNGIPTYHKLKHKSIENSQLSLFQHINRKLKTNKYKQNLKKYYNSLVSQPDYNETYIFLPLHYQPEMTSNPSGDIFVDQLLCVDVLVNNLPSTYKIYVKEHPSQFYAHGEGHAGRIKEFYDDLLKYPNVRLISLDSDPFSLIKQSSAVATITGTAGWEAIVMQKPVIIFGLSWYEGYDGVLKITDSKSVRNIKDFIENFKFSQNDLFNYLYAFQKNSFRAYYYRGLKAKMNQGEDECIKNLVDSVANELNA